LTFRPESGILFLRNSCFLRREAVAEKKTILVVEDEISVLDVLEAILTQAGYGVIRAMDGKSAVRKARENPKTPDLILADIRMPLMNGFEMRQELRSDPMTRRIPFIFVTGSPDRSDKPVAFGLGAARYITKPFTQEQILTAVGSALADREARDRLCALKVRQHSGSLAEASVFSLIDFFYVNRWSGKVRVTSGDKLGVLWFEGGEPVVTQVGQKRDWTALEEMLSWKEGTFELVTV
jgi:CheY-like chemotaxis protein